MPDYYGLMGVSPDASPEDLRAAFRRAALTCHPDTHPNDPAAEERFRELSAAYDILSDPAKRAEYDRSVAAPRRPLLDAVLEDLGSVTGFVNDVFSFIAPRKPMRKQAECGTCGATGKLKVDLGPLQILKTCPDCEP